MMWRLACVLALLQPALSAVRGVAPEDAARYVEGQPFECDEGLKIPFDRVNDDYCDCDDGTDEPATSACSGLDQKLFFFCENQGYKAERVPQLRLNDGICDCCDGTDEYANPAAGCKDVCAEVAATRAKEESEKAAKRDAGLAAKAELVKKAAELSASTAVEVKTLTAKLEEQKKVLAAAEEAKTKFEAVEKEERAAIQKKSEEAKVEWEAAQVVRRQERAATEAAAVEAVKAAQAQHGAFVKGMEVLTVKELKFKDGKGAVPAGTRGVVVGFEGAQAAAAAADDAEDELEEGEEDIQPSQPEGYVPKPVVKLLAGDAFTFVADEFDVKATGVTASAAQVEESCGEAKPNGCTHFLRTGNCDPNGEREGALGCDEKVAKGISGRCICSDDVSHNFNCEHEELTCQAVCEGNGFVASKPDLKPCPTLYPHTAPGLNLCYQSKEHAEAGSGPCGTWCSRDKTWYASNKCKWGCDCGKPCYAEPPAGPVAKDAATDESFTVDTGASHTNKDANTARSSFHTAKGEVTRIEGQLKEKGGGINFGPENVFMPLKGECVTLHTDYEYKLCPFGDVYQGATLMGKWGKWGEQSYGSWGGSDDLTVQHYENGQTCWSGPARSVEVKILCGPENVIKNIQEPSMCTYTMVWETPAACE